MEIRLALRQRILYEDWQKNDGKPTPRPSCSANCLFPGNAKFKLVCGSAFYLIEISITIPSCLCSGYGSPGGVKNALSNHSMMQNHMFPIYFHKNYIISDKRV